MKQQAEKIHKIIAKSLLGLSSNEIDFLSESNHIEQEFSIQALEDAEMAWKFAKTNMNKKMTITYIKTIHKILMQRIHPRIAGNIRKVDVWVSGKDVNRKCLAPRLVRQHLKLWLQEFRYNASENGIKRSHIEFEKIHPFEDGNGRVGRILMNIMRLNAGLPIMIIYNEEKFKYYGWFRE